MVNKLSIGVIGSCLIAASLNTNAATVIPSDYMVGGNVGDTWTYENLDTSQFTLTLSEITSGPYSGYFELGNNVSSTVYDVTNDVLTIHEIDNTPVDPAVGLVFSEIELGQIVTLNDDPVNPSMYLFWDIPSITVQAGTYTDVIALVWLDDNFSSNAANTFLELDSSVTAGVTDINYYAQGIGEVAFVGIAAETGLSDGTGYELVSTTVVPVPAALWLFGSGIIGLAGIARRKKS